MDKKCVLKIENLTKKYNGKVVIESINMNVYEGDIYGLIGPNGAGKSTTIKSIVGLIKINDGKIMINGYDILSQREKYMSSIGAMVESPSFYKGLSGYKNLCLYANLYKLPQNRVDEVLDLVKLTKEKNKKVSKYSLGMKQRLGIARAFINNPSIVILDEPTNGLDPNGIKEIRNLISELSAKYKITFIISSHILTEIQALCNRIGVIDNGVLKVEGAVSELLNAEEEVIEIRTNEVENTIKILNETNISLKYEKIEGGIKVRVKKGNFQDINKILVMNNISLDSITCMDNSLEEYFFNITKGGQKYD